MNHGAPKGNGNSVSHGIYRRHLTETEQVDYDRLEIDKIDDELRLTKIRLARALEAEATQGNDLILVETVDNLGLGAESMAPEKIETRKATDFYALIDKLTARVESLTKTRQALLVAKGSLDDDITREDTYITPDEPVPEKPVL